MIEGREGYAEGVLKINIQDGTFFFEIYENNHAVENVENHSSVFWVLFKFLDAMPVKGNKYGALVFHQNEYDVHYGSGARSHRYGGWKHKWERV